MKFGVCLPNYGKSLARNALADSAQLAENLGYDSIWTTDHILVPKKYQNPYGNILDSLMSLAYVGAVTERIYLGTSVLVLPVRNPIIVAKQAATIDYLTGGRLILGTAVGWMEEEFENLGSSFQDRSRRFEEAITLIRTLYQNEYPQFHGHYHKFIDATFKPKPRDLDSPRIWFGGNSNMAILRAAKLADGWQPVGVTVQTFSRGAQKIRSMLGERRQFTLSLRIHVDLNGKTEPYHAPGGEFRDVIVGNREQVVRTIEKYREVGLEHLVCYFGDTDLEQLKGKMKQFATEVATSLRD